MEIISRLPENPQFETPLLFVHGAWHGAWCWDRHFLPYFAQRGFAAHALSLRGHGESPGRERLRWLRIRDYVEDVAQVANTLPSVPIVIGHSMGGFVVQKYLEQYYAPTAVLLAAVPPRGAIGATLKVARTTPLAFIEANLRWQLYPVIGTPARAHRYLFSADAPQQLVTDYFEKLQDESYLAFLDMLFLTRVRPQSVQTPLLVLGAAQDRVISPAEVQATARAYRTEARIFDDVAHDLMLEPTWQRVADYIIDWLLQSGS